MKRYNKKYIDLTFRAKCIIEKFDKVVCIKIESSPPLKWNFEIALRKSFYDKFDDDVNLIVNNILSNDFPYNEWYMGVTKNFLKWYSGGHSHEYNAKKHADVFALAKAKKWEQIVCDAWYDDGTIKDLNGNPLYSKIVLSFVESSHHIKKLKDELQEHPQVEKIEDLDFCPENGEGIQITYVPTKKQFQEWIKIDGCFNLENGAQEALNTARFMK